jgi:hypothetical protein
MPISFRFFCIQSLIFFSIINTSCTGKKVTKTTVLKIFSKTNSAEIGRITFGPKGPGQLTISTTDHNSDEKKATTLSAAWKEIQNSVLELTEHKTDKGIRKNITRQVKPDDPEFRWAVYDTLERRFGYSVVAE